MKFHDIEQNTDEWFDLRAGKITSSAVAKVMAYFGVKWGDPAKEYAQHLALERFTGKRIEKVSYRSKAMQRGHDLEPIARGLYEMDQMVSVTNGGFFDDGKTGDSPDGLVGKTGGVEIKSVEISAHWKRIKRGGIDTAYQHQVDFHILKTEREWFDFISFCPDFPEDMQLYIHRVHKDENRLLKMRIRLAQFEELIEENILLLKNK